MKACNFIRAAAVALAFCGAATSVADTGAGGKPVIDCAKIRGVCYGIRPEACELVPMCDLPTTKIAAFRKDPNADLREIRKLAYSLALRSRRSAR